MTQKDKNLARIATKLVLTEGYPKFKASVIRKIIIKCIGPSSSRILFGYLNMVKAFSKEVADDSFNVDDFCNVVLEREL